MASELSTLAEGVAALISGHPEFSGVTVITRKAGNVVNQIQRALAKEKLCVVVLDPSAKVIQWQGQRPVWEVTLVVRAVENVLLNSTGRSAMEVGERIAVCLRALTPAVPGAHLLTPTTIEPINIAASAEQDEESDYAGCEITFTTKLALQPAV